MAFGVKTNEGATKHTHQPHERPGTRAQVKFVRMSAYKARQVIDSIRGLEVNEADSLLRFTERDAARVIRKCLASAVANAVNNDGLDPDNLYVSACYVDEGMTIKRFRPRARGRATKVRKRTCHITVIVSPMTADRLAQIAVRDAARDAGGTTRTKTKTATQSRAERVARSKKNADTGTDDAAVTEETENDLTATASDAVDAVTEVDEVAEVVEAETTEVEAETTETAEVEEASDEPTDEAVDTSDEDDEATEKDEN